MPSNEEQLLEHMGVLGMKWGKRRAASKTSKPAKVKKVKEPKPEKVKKVKEAKPVEPKKPMATSSNSKRREREWGAVYKNRSQLSDAELAAAITRLRLENELNKQATAATTQQKARNAKIFAAIKAFPTRNEEDDTTIESLIGKQLTTALGQGKHSK